MFLMEAEHFCSIVAVSIPFLLFEILIMEKIRISFLLFLKFQIHIRIFDSENRRLQIPRDN
jgi:hypothetical protein